VKRALLLALLVLSLAVNAAVGLQALRRARMGGPGAMPAEPLLFQRVQLTPAQRTAILARRTRLMGIRAETSARLGQLRAQLAAALAEGEAGRPKLEAVLAQLEGAQRDYQRSVVEHLLAVRETLAPDQRPIFAELLGERLRAGWMMQPDGMTPGDRGGGAR